MQQGFLVAQSTIQYMFSIALVQSKVSIRSVYCLYKVGIMSGIIARKI